MTQKELISKLLNKNKNTVIVGSLGNISKDLSELQHKNKILVKGAMGCAMAVGFGYALGSKKKVLVIIGDGSFLMKLGSVSTILASYPQNLSVAILNNKCYNSCGGQKTNFKYIEKYVKKLPNIFKLYEVST